jgi:Protein of unknown function (DUF2281)
MNAAEKLYELAKTLPEERVVELLDFAEYLLQKRSRLGVADATEKTLDFRQAAGLGQEIWQGVDVEQYIEQERMEWD